MKRNFSSGFCLSAITLALFVAACGGGGGSSGNDGDHGGDAFIQPTLGAHAKTILTVDGYRFRDLNGNGKLDPYEDWRLPAEARAEDLVYSPDPAVKMTLAEKAGFINIRLMMVPIGGNYPASEIGGNPTCAQGELGKKYVCEIATGSGYMGSLGTTQEINELNARYFVLRTNPPVSTLVTWLNNVQEIAEESRLGIPVVIVSNPRNHAAQGIGLAEASGVYSYWPGTLGLAATHDPALVEEFAQIAAKEWRATGIRKGYMYQIDLATEPRWVRNNGTFGDDPDLVSQISAALVKGFQGETLGPDSIALTTKHFPGNGAAPRGIDSHFEPGKYAVYPTAGSLINYQLKPFQAAIDAGTSSIMTYYQAPSNASAEQLPKDYWYSPTQQFEEVGAAFNSMIVKYLYEVMGFKGYLNTDSRVTLDDGIPWGVETLESYQRIAKSLNAGIALLSGADIPDTLRAVNEGLVAEATVDAAVVKALKEMFLLGLFENPYVDPETAATVVKSAEAQAKAELAHRKSIVLLKNGGALPLARTSGSDVRIYGEVFASSGAQSTQSLRTLLQNIFPSAQIVTDYTQATHSILLVQPSTYTGTDAEGQYVKIALDADTGIDTAKIKQIGAATKTIVAINMGGQPWLLNEIEPSVDAIVATYDVTSDALFDVLTGAFNPTGRLPMSIPKDQAAIDSNARDVPGHYESFDYAYRDVIGNIYQFGFGLSYR
jgi:beta-glucosidase